MRRTFGPTAGFLTLLAALAAGCGGGGAAPPTLPHALGGKLVDQTHLVEASLARGDSCAAAMQAARLRDAVANAVATGQVPAALRTPLSDSVASLVGEIRCVPPPPPHHTHGDEGGHGHHHGKGRGDGGDEGRD